MNGILLVDKPKGWTSFDVVAKIRGILARHQSSVTGLQLKELATGNRRQKTVLPKVKVGHTGTLDPLATGLLVILLGDYTKKATELSKVDKTYEVTMKLGETSTTGDEEGTKTKVNSKKPTEAEVLGAIKSFVGEIKQVPPIYSAIKVNGKRAYKLAREGKKIELKPRKVKVYEITDVKYTYPLVNFTVKVSSGTYIRSLVEDIGQKLGTGAYTTDLRRTRVGVFNATEVLIAEELDLKNIESSVRM